MTAPLPHPQQPHRRAPRHAAGPTQAIALPAWQQRGVYASLGLLTATGFVWLVVHVWLPESDAAALPYKLWAMRVHAAAALVSLVMAGSVLTHHVRLAWRLKKNRISGSLITGTLAVLAATGYALGYAPEGLVRQWSSWGHWGVGVAVPLVLTAHVLLGHRQRRIHIKNTR